jgi:hypothetical protein
MLRATRASGSVPSGGLVDQMRRPRSSSGSSASSYNQEEREQNDNSEAEQNYNQEEQNYNQEEHIHDEQAEMDQLLQSARKARHDEGRKPILASCLELFYLQDEIDPSHLDIVTLNLTPEEIKQLIMYFVEFRHHFYLINAFNA